MTGRDQPFQRYEDAALQVVADLAQVLGVRALEGAQTLLGLRTGTNWHVEGLAWRNGADGFLLIECRRVTTGQKQEEVGGLVYRVSDTGADGAILVTPVTPQAGALKVADSESVTTLLLDADATAQEYVARLLHSVFVTRAEHVSIGEAWSLEVERADGTVVRYETP